MRIIAVTISDVPSFPAADRAQVNVLERKFFNDIEANGVEVTMVAQFKSVGSMAVLTDDMLTAFKTVDSKCGKLLSVERYDEEAFGSHVVRDHLVAVHAGCMVRWDLTFIKPQNVWVVDHFNFHTYEGEQWKR
jgi:hypothetical protein